MVYTTCTFAPEENEGIVEAMLRKFDAELSIEPIKITYRVRWQV